MIGLRQSSSLRQFIKKATMENNLKTQLIQVRSDCTSNAKPVNSYTGPKSTQSVSDHQLNMNISKKGIYIPGRGMFPSKLATRSIQVEKYTLPLSQPRSSTRRILPSATTGASKPTREAPKTSTTTLSEEEKIERTRLRIETNNRFKAHLDSLPLLDYPSSYQVTVINDADYANERIHELMEINKEEPFFGVDLEWPPQFVKGRPENKTTLVQICSNKEILLFQIAHMRSFPIELRRFFEEKTILKSGVNINSDGLKLQRDFGFMTNGLVELREMSDGYVTWTHNLRSLRALTGMFLFQNMPKGKVRMSNWGKAQLTEKQVKYAALDAYASYKIFMKLKDLRGNKPYKIQHMSSRSNQPETNAQAKKSKIPSTFPSSTVTILQKASSGKTNV